MSLEPDDDGDVPAVEGNIEAADAPDAPAAARADDNEVGGADAVIQRKPRVFSKKARELFKTAAEKLKAQLKDEDEDFGATDDEPAAEVAAAVAAPAVAAAAVAAAVEPPAPPTPPAPSLDPQIEQLRQRLDARDADLTAREKAIQERESTIATDFDGFRDKYFDDPAAATAAFVRRMLGAADTDDITEEVADLITELSGSVLKVPLAEQVRSRLEAKRALKSVKAHKLLLTKREQEIENKRKAAEREQQRASAISMLDTELKKSADTYKFLLAEDNPGKIVFDVVEYQVNVNGKDITWAEGAKLADDYYKALRQREFDKRRHLLSGTPDKEPAKASDPVVPQGDPSGIRRSHTITNAASAATAPAKSKPAIPLVDQNGRWNREAHRAQTLAKMAQRFKEHPPDE